MPSDWGLTEFQNETANILRIFLPEDATFLSQNSIYEYALFTGDEALQEIYIRYLAWNCDALIHSPAWTNLLFGLVKALMSRSDLVVSNETVILNGLEKRGGGPREHDYSSGPSEAYPFSNDTS